MTNFFALLLLLLTHITPVRSVTWVKGAGGASCDYTCSQRDGCSEDAWPKTETEFYAVSKLAGQVCESTQTGSAKYDPSTDGRYCGWQGPEEMEEGETRCSQATDSGTYRFCGKMGASLEDEAVSDLQAPKPEPTPQLAPASKYGSAVDVFWSNQRQHVLEQEGDEVLGALNARQIGGKARGAEYWENYTFDANSTLRSGYYHNPSLREVHSIQRRMGYDHLATSTRYGNTCCASCGSVNTAELVKGTGFYAVASAESMQADGIGDGHYCTSSPHTSRGTTGMGCLSCARGKFLKAHPFSYPLWAQPGDEIFSKELKIVVADTCPHTGNEGWCPRHQGQGNKFGVKHHFDFADPPAKYDNYYFVWSKMECPNYIKRRYARLSRC
ncbi:unnamed protein product [Durusdinium trenchii]|uniref:Uncharacterized protein n=2 Tax=Durusdinium trenchii TaxID=1381693 RepID=A0ABP0RCG6_9DINO